MCWFAKNKKKFKQINRRRTQRIVVIDTKMNVKIFNFSKLNSFFFSPCNNVPPINILSSRKFCFCRLM